MPVGWRFLRDAFRRSSSDQHNVHDGTMLLLRVVADSKLCGVRRNAVIVITAVREAGIDNFRLATAHRQTLDVALAIEEERPSTTHPIRGLEAPRCQIHHAPACHGNRNGLERPGGPRLSRPRPTRP